MNIYQTLLFYKHKRKSFLDSDEYHFFLHYRHLLDKASHFSFLYNSGEVNDFDVIRANIIIQSILNKKIIDEEILSLSEYDKKEKIDHLKFISAIKERTIELPYVMYKKTKLFIPIFSLALNGMYVREPEKILCEPYNSLLKDFQSLIVDPFDSYGTSLYESDFTRLVKVGTNGKVCAFFHYDNYTIYIVNEQGRLDCSICLFDRFLKRINSNHMLERLKPVVDAYFSSSRTMFIFELYKQGFISETLFSMIKKEDQAK